MGIKRNNKYEKGQSTLEMIVVAPILFCFLFMVFSYGEPIYKKIGLQNISYSYAMAATRFPAANNFFTYNELIISVMDVTDSIPGFTSDDNTVFSIPSGSSGDLSDIKIYNWDTRSMLIDTRITAGHSNDPYFSSGYGGEAFAMWQNLAVGGAISPHSPFISCEGDSGIISLCKNQYSTSWIWTQTN